MHAGIRRGLHFAWEGHRVFESTQNLIRLAGTRHFCSWLELCPGTRVSGGKVHSARTLRSADRLRHALKFTAISLSCNDSVLDALYLTPCARMDRSHADMAVAHKLARIAHFIPTRG